MGLARTAGGGNHLRMMVVSSGPGMTSCPSVYPLVAFTDPSVPPVAAVGSGRAVIEAGVEQDAARMSKQRPNIMIFITKHLI